VERGSRLELLPHGLEGQQLPVTPTALEMEWRLVGSNQIKICCSAQKGQGVVDLRHQVPVAKKWQRGLGSHQHQRIWCADNLRNPAMARRDGLEPPTPRSSLGALSLSYPRILHKNERGVQKQRWGAPKTPLGEASFRLIHY
jgi:hypothetical protein